MRGPQVVDLNVTAKPCRGGRPEGIIHPHTQRCYDQGLSDGFIAGLRAAREEGKEATPVWRRHVRCGLSRVWDGVGWSVGFVVFGLDRLWPVGGGRKPGT